VLSYIQEKLVDIWKENVLEDLKGVERTNIVMVCPQQRAGLVQCNPYAMKVDRERNCYACGRFGHMA